MTKYRVVLSVKSKNMTKAEATNQLKKTRAKIKPGSGVSAKMVTA